MRHLLRILILVVVSFQLTQSPIHTLAQTMEEEYDAATTGILETLYGDGFLSHGGPATVDRMFKGISLRNKKMLDIGCGFGGPSIYLAKKYSVDITGIDPVKHILDKATKIADQQQLATKLTYVWTPQLPYPFADETFDIAFSKEALLHSREKEAVIKEIFRVLKPGGQVVILDWVFSEITNDSTLDLFKVPTFSPISQQQYIEYFKCAGFVDISSTDQNNLACRYTAESIKHLKKNKASLIQKFGENEYKDALLGWDTQYVLFKQKQILVSLFKARKPETITSVVQPARMFKWYNPFTWFGK